MAAVGVGERDEREAEDRAVRPEPSPLALAGRSAALSPELSRLAQEYLPPHAALVPGNQLTLLRDGIEAFPAMLDAIRAARTYVRLETYIFRDDAMGQLVSRALVEAAGRGVQVSVLYDAVGSFWTPRAFFQAMREQGVDVRAWRPFRWGVGLKRFFQRNHRKILIVDGRVAFVGGLNIGSQWAPRGLGEGWRDDVVRIEGPVVCQLERRFGATWWLMVRERLQRRAPVRARLGAGVGAVRGALGGTGAAPSPVALPAPEESAPGAVQGPAGSPREGVAAAVLSSRRAIHRAYLRAIRKAKDHVFIAAAYFVPDRRMLQALKDAAQRGVRVTLLLPEQSDHQPVRYASRAFYERLLSWGVNIHLWKDTVLHSKTAVVDGIWGTVGSFNLERMSLRFNHEVNLAFVDPRWGRHLEASVRKDCDACRCLDLDAWRKRPWREKLLERLFYAFRKVL